MRTPYIFLHNVSISALKNLIIATAMITFFALTLLNYF